MRKSKNFSKRTTKPNKNAIKALSVATIAGLAMIGGTAQAQDVQKAPIPTIPTYTLDEASKSSDTLYIPNYDTETGTVTDAYYKVNYSNTEFGTGTENSKDFNVKTSAGNIDVNVKYDNSEARTRTEIYSETETVEGSFVNNNNTDKDYAVGGAVRNESTITNINAGFAGNSSNSTTNAEGGAIFNKTGATISNINGYFIGNTLSPLDSDKSAYNIGGAVANDGSIGDIVADFIGNSINGNNRTTALGGAIYNTNKINSITGDFVGNSTTGNYAVGGAIYNSTNGNTGRTPEIGAIKGNFIGNTASSDGGAIFNNTYYNSNVIAKISSIEGDFIRNSSGRFGGAIWNNGTIGDIKGNFIENTAQRGGAIYNVKANYNTPEIPIIKSITGDFIGNHIDRSDFGAAIYNEGVITDGIKGNFIANTITGSGMGAGIYNVGPYSSNYKTLINGIQGDFVQNKITGSGYISGAGIYNERAIINNGIIGNFIQNELVGNGGTLEGAAITNKSGATISAREDGISISGNFIGNKISGATYADGVAISNRDGAKIDGEIVGNFSQNSVTSDSVEGTAIANKYATIGKITGKFVENTAQTTNTAQGGAIYNEGSITNGLGDSTFIRNSITSENGYAGGGALYNYGSIQGESAVKLYFEGNSAVSKTSNAQGGAWFNGGLFASKDITADFINNYVEGKSTSEGGAFHNSTTLGNLTANFIGNYVSGQEFVAGGALYNRGSIEKISGLFQDNFAKTVGIGYGAEGGALYSYNANVDADFLNNYVEADGNVKGGAIYSYNLTLNGEHTYSNNRAISHSKNSLGGAISSEYGPSIENVKGLFSNNYAQAGEFAMGGSVYSANGIKNVDGTFLNSYAKSETKNAQGGAIYSGQITDLKGVFANNYVDAKEYSQGGAVFANSIETISNATFDNNKAISAEKNADGGAINSTHITSIENSTFSNNSATSKSSDGYAHGGAIYTGGIESIKNSNFINNSSSFAGGAIYSYGKIDTIENSTFASNKSRDNGGALIAEAGIGTITNSSFINNTSTNGKGGAIYTTKDLNIVSKNGYNSLFTGNTAKIDGKVEQNAIYMETPEDEGDVTLTLDAQSSGRFVLNDTINGNSYNLKMTGDKTGEVYFNNKIVNANITQNNVTSYVNDASQLNYNNNLAINSGIMNINNMGLAPLHLNSFVNDGTININSVDINPATETMGKITADSYGSQTGTINVNGLNVLADPNPDKLQTNVFFADSAFANTVKYNGSNEYMGKIYKYTVGYSPESGEFQFVRGGGSSGADSFNPSVLSSSVNAQAGTNATVNETFHYVFEHADAFTQLPSMDRFAKINENRYALSSDFNNNIPGIAPEFNNKAGWFRPYVTFEKMNLRNSGAVNATTYGSLVGFDSDFQDLKHGWTGVTTGYIGYTGSQLRYSGADTTMNGGLIGFTQTFYKGDFWTALTLSTGASAGQTNTMYGKEDFTTLFAGVGSKTGYNFEFKEGKYIIQPVWFMSYTMGKTFDYTNAAGVRIESSPMHSIMLNPSLRFIANTKNGWQPYASVGMVWNAMNESSTTANGTKLPESSIKPYVEYGVGLQKRFKDDFIAFGQAMIRNGGRNGISLTAGFRWAIGRDKEKPLEKVQGVNNKTIGSGTKAGDKTVSMKKFLPPTVSIKVGDSKVSHTTDGRKIVKQLSQAQREKLAKQYQNTTRTTSIGDMKKL